jgi:hypothetical protein
MDCREDVAQDVGLPRRDCFHRKELAHSPDDLCAWATGSLRTSFMGDRQELEGVLRQRHAELGKAVSRTGER